MTIGIGLGVILFIVLLMNENVLSNKNPFKEPVFESFGTKDVPGLSQLSEKLESSLNAEYMENVKERILSKNLLNEKEYDYYLLEMKRFFILTSLAPNVPMYNEKVDVIWHEMLMFTKSYQDFCHRFIGKMIHHEPNTKNNSGSSLHTKNDKAFFEWLYVSLFETNDDTKIIYPHLFSQKLSSDFLTGFANLKESQIIKEHFTPSSKEGEMVVKSLVEKTKENVINIQNYAKVNKVSLQKMNQKFKKGDSSDDDFVYLSLLQSQLINLDDDTNTHSGNHTGHTHHGDGHTGGHHCSSCSSHSCSSCSSCGGGCSS
jgi:hypothetical protein